MALKPCYWTDFSRGMYGVKNNHNTVVLCSLTRELARHLCSSTPLVYMLCPVGTQKKDLIQDSNLLQ